MRRANLEAHVSSSKCRCKTLENDFLQTAASSFLAIGNKENRRHFCFYRKEISENNGFERDLGFSDIVAFHTNGRINKHLA